MCSISELGIGGIYWELQEHLLAYYCLYLIRFDPSCYLTVVMICRNTEILMKTLKKLKMVNVN
jgi:hypothetical protein